MHTYIQVEFSALSPGMPEILIARLMMNGYEGFEETENSLKAFIPESIFDQSELMALAEEYQVLYSVESIPARNWNQAWESTFEPVTVDNFAHIRAEFHPAFEGVEHEIVITPKMSFGTGHHATTEMMVRMMRGIDIQDKRVFDFGTGTGILAILAEKMGAAEIYAIDYDEWSIANAAENIEMNHCSRIHLEKSDRFPDERSFDVILANINRNVILDNLAGMTSHLIKGGTLLLSGLLENDRKDVVQAAENYRFRVEEITEQNNWICLMLRH